MIFNGPSLQELSKKIRLIPNLRIDTSPGGLSESIRHLKHIPVRTRTGRGSGSGVSLVTLQDPVQKAQVLHAYTRSIRTIWIMNTPIGGIGLLMGILREF